jgi:hypothetical protein
MRQCLTDDYRCGSIDSVEFYRLCETGLIKTLLSPIDSSRFHLSIDVDASSIALGLGIHLQAGARKRTHITTS